MEDSLFEFDGFDFIDDQSGIYYNPVLVRDIGHLKAGSSFEIATMYTGSFPGFIAFQNCDENTGEIVEEHKFALSYEVGEKID